MVFLGYPEEWIRNGTLANLSSKLLDDFLRKTKRVRCIIVLLEWMEISENKAEVCRIVQVAQNKSLALEDQLNPFEGLEDYPVLAPSIWDMVNGGGATASVPMLQHLGVGPSS